MKKIPYGISDFERIKTDNYYYIDKTHFIPEIEDAPDYLFFLRPRRFGKSLIVNMLIAYYDIGFADKFDNIFQNTFILDNSTKLKNSFHVMKFDFSAVDITDYIDSFKNHLNLKIDGFVDRYDIDLKFNIQNPIDKLEVLFDYCIKNNISIYIFIDEYDNFVNKLLVSDINIYKDLVTTKEALYKQFFTMLKVGTSSNNSAIKKMFFTGVSPLALYDVTSGSNIGSNLSLKKAFNDFAGVTKKELDKIIIHYKLEDKKEMIFSRCTEWYDNYLFNEDIPYTIYNTDMIFYYLHSIIKERIEPKPLIDINVRTDYSKLKYLIYTNKKLNGNFDLVNRLIQNRQVIVSEIKDNFSAFEMLQGDNFSSFLFSLGFVTLEKYRVGLNLKIPNQTIRKIMAEFIENVYKDIDFNLQLQHFNNHLINFGYEKDLEVFRYLNEQVKLQSSIRDFIDGETFMKGFLTAYLSLNPYYEVKTEEEITKGFVDILLNPILDEIPYGGVIEIKYISKSGYTENLLQKKIKEAKDQLNRYDVTKVKLFKTKKFLKVILVYKSWELVYCEIYDEKKMDKFK